VKNKRDTKWLIGDQMLPDTAPGSSSSSSKKDIPKVTDLSGLLIRRAHERGFVVNWELENQVLGRAFAKNVLDPYGVLPASMTSESLLKECSLLATLPVCAPAPIAKDLDENVFEKWGLKKYTRTNPGPLAHRAVWTEGMEAAAAAAAAGAGAGAAAAPVPDKTRTELHRLCGVVVDSGYSFTHILPVYEGKTIVSAVKRINAGGKLLTNYLKELVSYRTWNMMDETYIINNVKEQLAYVSTDFERELQAAK
jgi:actin-related protein 6